MNRWNRARLLSFAALVALAGSATAQARRVTLEVPWRCPQTIGADHAHVSDARNISITFDDATGQPSPFPAALTRLIRRAEEHHPRVDFFPCFMEFLRTTAEVANTHLETLSIDDDTRYERKAKLAMVVQDAVMKYGKGAYDRGGISPVGPDRPLNPALTSTEVTEMETALARDCQVRRPGPWNRTWLDPRALDRTFLRESLPRALTGLSDSCVRSIGRDYAGLLLGAQLDDRQCRANASLCSDRRASLARAATHLSSLHPELADLFADDVATAVCAGNWTPFDRGLNDFLNDVDNVAGCEPLNAGISRKYDGRSPTDLDRGFTLTREADIEEPGGARRANYQITLDLAFTTDEGSEDEAADMRSTVRDCLAEASPYLNGPPPERDRLSLRLLEDAPPGFEPRPPQHDIAVVMESEEDFRSHSRAWSHQVGCEVITHELMHLLGLVDEYDEPGRGVHVDSRGRPEFVDEGAEFEHLDCRAVGPANSLMHDQDVAFESVRAGRVSITRCACPDEMNSTECRQEIETTGCPANRQAESEVSSDDSAATVGGFGLDEKGWFITLATGTLVPPRASLLYPAQFRALVLPDCRALNGTYFACAQDVNETSRGHYGIGCTLGRPDACSGGGEAWLQ